MVEKIFCFAKKMRRKCLNSETRKGTAGDFHQLTWFVVDAQNQQDKATSIFIQCHIKNKT